MLQKSGEPEDATSCAAAAQLVASSGSPGC